MVFTVLINGGIDSHTHVTFTCATESYFHVWTSVLPAQCGSLLAHTHWDFGPYFVRLHLKCDGTGAETRFRLSAKRTSPFKSAGASVQSTAGSPDVSVNNAGYTMFRGSVKSTGYPLHSPVSPSLPLPCVTVCHHISNAVFLGYPYVQYFAIGMSALIMGFKRRFITAVYLYVVESYRSGWSLLVKSIMVYLNVLFRMFGEKLP
jgi:hypothetical protein